MNTLPSTSSDAAVAGIAILIVVGIYLIIGALAFASYILTSLSLYTIGSRRLVKNPWLAWLPIGREWVLGKIAEDYDAKNGINRKKKHRGRFYVLKVFPYNAKTYPCQSAYLSNR